MDNASALAALGTLGFGLIFIIAIFICDIVGAWKTVDRLGGRGWSQIVPVFNAYELGTVSGVDRSLVIAYTALTGCTVAATILGSSFGDMGTTIMGLVGFGTFIIGCIVANGVAKRFGKGTGFTVGLVLLPVIFYMILGFGSTDPVEE